MSYADRIKETSTTTGTGAIALAGAAAGYKSFASRLTVGDRVAYCIEGQTPGEWEIGIGTLSASTTLTRTTVSASSNADALVNFSAGTKNVFVTATASQLRDGLVDPTDVGFDIVLIAGQSNAAGRGTIDAVLDTYEPRIFQWGCKTGQSRYQTMFPATEPLQQTDGFTAGQMGPSIAFAKAYLRGQPTNRMVLLVPCAQGSTALVSTQYGAPPWAVGNTLYLNAIAQSNAAISAAISAYPNSRFVGAYFGQGEHDSGNGVNTVAKASYVAGLKAVFAGWRSDITGASNSFAIIAGMCPGFIALYAEAQTIRDAHIQVAAETNRAWYVPGRAGYDDGIHYNAAGLRFLGTDAGLAVPAAKRYLSTPTPASAVTMAGPASGVVSVASTNFTLSISGAITGTVRVTPADGGGGGTFTPSYRDLLTGTASGTFTYTPASTGAKTISATNNGGLSNPSAITYTSEAADSTAPTLTSPTGAQTGPTTATIGVTTNEANGTLYALVSINATETAATVKAGGATQAITTTGAKTVNATGLTASTLYYGHLVHRDAAGNDSAVATSASFTTAASATAPATMAAPVATGGDATASVVMVAPADGGSAITGYTVTSSPAGGTDSNAGTTGLTHAITGLTNGTAYTFTATATNAVGTSAASPASNSVTPAAAAATTWDPAYKDSRLTLSNGNLTLAAPAGTSLDFISTRSTVSKTTGKWYWEVTVGSAGEIIIGIGNSAVATNAYPGLSGQSNVGWYGASGQGAVYRNGAAVTIGSQITFASGNVLGFALDLDASPPTLRYYKNGVAQFGGAYTFTASGATFASIAHRDKTPVGASTANFGASAFAYTPPAGHVGLQ